MLYLKTLLVQISLFSITFSLLATEQVPDLIIHKSDTFYFSGTFEDDFPLYQLMKDEKYFKHFEFNKSCKPTNCYRAYQAIWKIMGRKIYLKELIDCCTDKPIELSKVFRKKLKKKKGVKAFWISKVLTISSMPINIFNLEEDIQIIDLEIKKGKLSKKHIKKMMSIE